MEDLEKQAREKRYRELRYKELQAKQNLPNDISESSPSASDSFFRKGASGATFGLSDEIAGGLEAAGQAAGVKGLGGKVKDVGLTEEGPTLDLERLKNAYTTARDKERQGLESDSKANPKASLLGELLGGLTSPVGAITEGATALKGAEGLSRLAKANAAVKGAAKGGAIYGALSGFGNAEGSALDQALNTGVGGALGGTIGAATPYIGAGVGAVADKLGLADKAYLMAFRSLKPSNLDLENLTKEQRIAVGKELINNKLNNIFQSPEKLAEKSGQLKQQTGESLEHGYNVLNDAGVEFKGIDLKRDKPAIMAAARERLGMTEGGEASLARLEKYIDEQAAIQGDNPNNEMVKQYGESLKAYKDKFKQYLKDKKKYKEQTGFDDTEQGLFPTQEDFQRTVKKSEKIKLTGKDANTLEAEQVLPRENPKQMPLQKFLTKTEDEARSVSGDTNLWLRQREAAIQKQKDDALAQVNRGLQLDIEGAKIVPDRYVRGRVTSVEDKTPVGQLEMLLGTPLKPTRPVRPDEVRNPLSLKKSQDFKTSLDDVIRNAKGFMTKDDAAAGTFGGARTYVQKQIADDIENIGGNAALDALKANNSKYGNLSVINRLAKSEANKDFRSNALNLGNLGAAGIGLGYGAYKGDLAEGLAAAAAAKALQNKGAVGTSKLLHNLLGLDAGKTITPAATNYIMELINQSNNKDK